MAKCWEPMKPRQVLFRNIWKDKKLHPWQILRVGPDRVGKKGPARFILFYFLRCTQKKLSSRTFLPFSFSPNSIRSASWAERNHNDKGSSILLPLLTTFTTPIHSSMEIFPLDFFGLAWPLIDPFVHWGRSAMVGFGHDSSG